jgi:threonine dehydrogenase-like Zn-dependent dehydrogenase
MKALQLQSVGNLELVEASKPIPGDDELLVRTEAAVICTSDLIDIRANPFGIKLPVIMGHEASGVVEQVGTAVKDFRPGDRVATHPVHPCYSCGTCTSGLTHLCENMGHFAFNRQGTFAEFFPVREDRARKIPAQLDPAVAALAEPLAVCIEALDQARLKPGERLLIMGDGPFGILIAMLALQRGDLQVVISGHHDWRLSFAEGAVQVNTRGVADPVTALRKESTGGFDAVIVGVSRAEAYDSALALLRPRGRVVVFSPVFGGTTVDLAMIHMKELEIVGAVNDLDKFDSSVQALCEQEAAFSRIVTHRFPFADFRDAIALAGGGREQALKVAMVFQGQES